MRHVLVSGPGKEPITLDEVKDHLRVDHTNDDVYITGLIKTARKKAEQFTRRRLITQTWKTFLDSWPDEDYITLPFGQLQSVTHVKYTESDDTENTWSTDYYSVDTNSDPGRIMLDYGESWPTGTLIPLNPIEIQFVCGYGTNGSDVDPMILHAIKIIVSDMYENRETHVVGVSVSHFDTVHSLLMPYRIYVYESR